MTEELLQMHDWLAVRDAAIDELKHRLDFATAEPQPRLDEIRTLRRQLSMVQAWDPATNPPRKIR